MNTTLLVGGFALVLLYVTKKKLWALTFGAYLTYHALTSALNKFLVATFHINLSLNFIIAMFFIVPGAVFLTLFFDRGKKPLVIPGAVLTCFGAFFILTRFHFVNAFSLFFICIGVAFLIIHRYAKSFIGKFPLYFGVVLLGLAVLLAR